MGLDAVVYRSKANLPFDPDAQGATLDPSTGEYYFADSSLESALEGQFPRETRIAIHKRIGNISSVNALRCDAERALNKDSIILSKVLYSGTHSGDVIPFTSVPSLQEELLILKIRADQTKSQVLMNFASDMQELAAAALREANPIVF
jgi:hypothetical protein